MNRFNQALSRKNFGRPPVWFMRQAGRYHAHYQELRSRYGFETLCKDPKLAFETTMGPIDDFGFDAAILFSDILFPLEAMGMPLKFDPGPQFEFLLKQSKDVDRLSGDLSCAKEMIYQKEALKLLRGKLPDDKYGLIGFIGGPLTLYYFAAEGSHKQSGSNMREPIDEERFTCLVKKLNPILLEVMNQQASAGIDAMAVFESCAGLVDQDTFARLIVPHLDWLFKEFKSAFPKVHLIYYAKDVGANHWRCLEHLPLSCLGVDASHDLRKLLPSMATKWSLQGNFNQEFLRDAPLNEFEIAVRNWMLGMKTLNPEVLASWICGLGHGVLPQTPEENVRLFLKIQKEVFADD